jgi:hypothetical protein
MSNESENNSDNLSLMISEITGRKNENGLKNFIPV